MFSLQWFLLFKAKYFLEVSCCRCAESVFMFGFEFFIEIMRWWIKILPLQRRSNLFRTYNLKENKGWLTNWDEEKLTYFINVEIIFKHFANLFGSIQTCPYIWTKTIRFKQIKTFYDTNWLGAFQKEHRICDMIIQISSKFSSITKLPTNWLFKFVKRYL